MRGPELVRAGQRYGGKVSISQVLLQQRKHQLRWYQMSSRSSRKHVVAKSAVLQLLTQLVSLGSRANIGRAEPPVARFGSCSASKTIRAFEVIDLSLHTLL